jgi:hypothetical protein
MPKELHRYHFQGSSQDIAQLQLHEHIITFSTQYKNQVVVLKAEGYLFLTRVWTKSTSIPQTSRMGFKYQVEKCRLSIWLMDEASGPRSSKRVGLQNFDFSVTPGMIFDAIL